MTVDESQTKGARNVRTEEEQDEETALVFVSVVEVDAEEDADGDQSAVWDLHQGRDERGETEAFYNQRPKITDTAVWNIADAAKDEEEVELDVHEGFFDLIALWCRLSAYSFVQIDR